MIICDKAKADQRSGTFFMRGRWNTTNRI